MLALITDIVITVLDTKITMLFHTIVTHGMHQALTGLRWQLGGLSYDDKRETSHTVGEFVPQERSGGGGGYVKESGVDEAVRTLYGQNIPRHLLTTSVMFWTLLDATYSRAARALFGGSTITQM